MGRATRTVVRGAGPRRGRAVEVVVVGREAVACVGPVTVVEAWTAAPAAVNAESAEAGENASIRAALAANDFSAWSGTAASNGALAFLHTLAETEDSAGRVRPAVRAPGRSVRGGCRSDSPAGRAVRRRRGHGLAAVPAAQLGSGGRRDRAELAAPAHRDPDLALRRAGRRRHRPLVGRPSRPRLARQRSRRSVAGVLPPWPVGAADPASPTGDYPHAIQDANGHAAASFTSGQDGVPAAVNSPTGVLSGPLHQRDLALQSLG